MTRRNPLAGRVTLQGAIAEGRCACEGCPACRGEEGYPCGQNLALPDGAPRSICRWCRAQEPATGEARRQYLEEVGR